MIALVFADRPGHTLAPLTDRTCAALLPIAGKPLIEYTLEALAATDVRDVHLVISPHADAVERLVENGARWGLRVGYVLTRGNDDPEAVLRRLRTQRPDEEVLVLRGDFLRSGLLGTFLERAASVPAGTVFATIGGASAGVRLVRAHAPAPAGLAADLEAPLPDEGNGAGIEIDGAAMSRLPSLAAYHRANLDVAAGRYPGVSLPGVEVAPRVRIGRHSSVPARSIGGDAIQIGSRCRVHPEAELYGDTVVGDDVVVDRGATVRNAVILPHTYVGEMVDVHDAIVWGDRMIRISDGVGTQLTDPLLLAPLDQPVGTALGNGLHRLLGLAVLVLSLPLWPVALAAALLADPRRPFRYVRLVGNRRANEATGAGRCEFVAVESAAAAPVLRHLPWLLAVVRGDLRFVGVEALPPETAQGRTEEWERVRDAAPAGLIGPSLLGLAPGSPEDEKRVVEGFYARTRSPKEDLRWVLEGGLALFTARAWRAHRTGNTAWPSAGSAADGTATGLPWAAAATGSAVDGAAAS